MHNLGPKPTKRSILPLNPDRGFFLNYKVVHYQPGRGGCVIGGVEPSHWDQLKKSGSSWDSNPGPSGYRPGTLTTELLDLCGRGAQQLMLYILRAEFSSQQ